MNYANTIYKHQQQTDYPSKLIEYLDNRFEIGTNKNILDLGCGTGLFTKAIYSRFSSHSKIISIDRTEPKYSINFIQSDLEKKWNLKSNSFDVVFCKSVLEHIYNQEHFMNECLRVMKSEGKLILLVPNWKSQKNIFFDDPTHIHPYTKDSVFDLLDMFGFTNIQSEIFYQLPAVWKHSSLTFLCKFISLLVKPEHKPKNKFIRWSSETMILAYGEKP